MTRTFRSRLKAGVALTAILGQLAVTAGPASAFCGFYVAKADTKMFNKSSKVVLIRDGQQTAITMASDYEGKPDEFALVVPVPTFIERKQINVVDSATIDHLDAYTAPRLVQYYDRDPCIPPIPPTAALSYSVAAMAPQPTPMPVYVGVKIEAQYNVAEYDISILSAEQSDGLVHWLNDNGYRIPAGAEPVIGSYIKQKMHFFVAKVNVKRLNDLGRAYLQPLQVRYQTAKFMLPLRLGTVNANGPQDLTIFAMSRRGRIEAANYRTVKMPSSIDVPLFVEKDFPNFYKATFAHAVTKENQRAVFVEYAWDMGWCDPCAAEPMSGKELTALGVAGAVSTSDFGNQWAGNLGAPFVTRLHVRYDAQTFPEDLNFIETSDRENFQARYVMHHPFAGATSCLAGDTYRLSLIGRFNEEADNLSGLTGWPQEDIAARMAASGEPLTQRH